MGRCLNSRVPLAARDQYRVEREDKAGEGFVDFIFYPERKGADAILLELKMDSTPQEAICQIKKELCVAPARKAGRKDKGHRTDPGSGNQLSTKNKGIRLQSRGTAENHNLYIR